ncbi:MAG: sel1 repeat family protein [Helicobacteraceae bacterium]|jgi:TPR repeat protein|nr:sel1 repeat family protein [Helicobacteraceae bacterium]
MNFLRAMVAVCLCFSALFGSTATVSQEFTDALTAIGSGQKKKALDLFAKACKAGDKLSCAAERYVKANSAAEIDEAGIYQYACDQGVMVGCYNLAVLHEPSKPLENKERAASLFTLACENELSLACVSLGYLYPENSAKAEAMFLLSCEKEDPLGCLELANLYSRKEKDADALEAYQKACELGSVNACVVLQEGGIEEE